MSQTNNCPRHPDTRTNLRCGRCEELICPRCMVHGPVGVRCPECAQVRPPPTYDVSASYLARAIAVGLVLGVVGGVAFALLSPLLLRVQFLDVAALVGIGYLVGEGVSAAVNRKRGRALKFVASGGILVAYIVISIFGISISLFDLLAFAAAIYVAVNRF